MADWKEYKIAELGNVSTGKTPSINFPDEFGSDMPFITPTDYKNYSKWAEFSDRGLSQKGIAKLQNKILPPNSVLVTCIGSDMGKVVLNKVPVITNQQINSIIPNQNIANPDFLYYQLVNSYEMLRVYGLAGTAVPIVNKGDFENIILEIPSLPEQQAIAEVLSSLDDKIDLLHRQNKTLEAMAETLFRQWFVEEAEENWRIEKLGDIAFVQNGYAFKSSDFVGFEANHLEVLKMGHIEPGGGLRTTPKKDYVPREEKLKKWTLHKGDIIMAMTDMKDNMVILGNPAMIDKDDNYVLNQRVARIYLKNEEKLINNYLLYSQLKNPDFIGELQSKAHGGVQVNLSTEAIKDSDIIIPPIEFQKEKSPTVVDLYEKAEKNTQQINKLTKLRDALLPKLMSGDEVRVKITKAETIAVNH